MCQLQHVSLTDLLILLVSTPTLGDDRDHGNLLSRSVYTVTLG